MVTGQSFFGYVKADSFSTGVAYPLILLGLIFTIAIARFYRSEIAGIDWRGCLALLSVATLGGLLVVVPHIWNNDFGYSEFSNGEFLNYSQLASYSLQLQHSDAPIPWERMHQGFRDGIDFINATVASIAKQQPANIVQITAALLRAAYFSALLSLVRAIFASINRPTILTALIGLVLAFTSFDLFQFEVSFMAGCLSLSIAICGAALVSTVGISRLQYLSLYVVLNVAMLVSYPEAMIMLKIIEGFFVGERTFRDDDREFFKRWLVGNAAIIAVNPLLVWTKIVYAYAAATGSGGWNVIADPLSAPSSYIARIIGIEPIYRSDLALTHIKLVVFVVAAIVLAFQLRFLASLFKRLNSRALVVFPVAVLAFHVLPALKYGHFYAAAKLMLAWFWLLPLGFAAAYVAGNKTTRVVLVAAACLYFGANLETFRRAQTSILNMDTFKAAKESDAVIRVVQTALKNGSSVAINSSDPAFVEYWLQILDNHGITVAQTDQQAIYFRRFDGTNTSPPVSGSSLCLFPNFGFSWGTKTDLIWAANEPMATPVLFASHLLTVSVPVNDCGGPKQFASENTR